MNLSTRDRQAVNRAISILEGAFARERGALLSNPHEAASLARLRLGALEREEFHAFWLDAQHRLISTEVMSTGTVNATAVYPREFVKSALALNAAAVVVAHNHPSGKCDPSCNDWAVTCELHRSLRLVGVELLDHLVVGSTETVSMAALSAGGDFLNNPAAVAALYESVVAKTAKGYKVGTKAGKRRAA